jgi:hypothetical protein
VEFLMDFDRERLGLDDILRELGSFSEREFQ